MPRSSLPASVTAVDHSGDTATAEAVPAGAVLLPLPDVADTLGIPVTRVRQLLRDGKLIAVRGADGVLRVPADFLLDGEPLKGLAGLLTVLRDARYSADAALRWLYAPDASLPGTPVQALRENRGTEVKRRAQAAGW